VILGAVFFYGSRPALRAAAGYLAPRGEETAEVVILEGTQLLRNGAVSAGRELLSERKASRLVVVLHQTSREERFFALPEAYPRLVKKELVRSGFKTGQVLIIVTPVVHPITLIEAKVVLKELAGNKVRKAILVSEGFHTRRSLGVYRQEGEKLGMQIIAHPYYASYQKENWWQQTEGVRAFVTEYLKLGYYLLRGFISVKSLF
jgi:hypothetical protein